MPLPSLAKSAILHALNPHFLVGTTAVILEGQRVLLVRHTYRHKHPWGMPGGWVGRGEDPARTIVREVAEETGLVVTVERPVVVQHSRSPSRIDIAFSCTLVGGTFRPSAEVSAVEFFAFDAANSLLDERGQRILARARSEAVHADG